MHSVSFGSTYKINNSKNFNNSNLVDFCSDNNLEYSTKLEESVSCRNRYSTNALKVNATIIAPDTKDGLVETYLANKGIKFKKLDTQELLSKSKIESRVEKPLKDMQLVKLDAKKLDELIHNQDQNISYCEKTYNEYYRDEVESMLKSGDKIPATTLYITPMGESTKDTVKYINTFGANRLNDNQLSFMFNQESFDEPDQCMFFGMKDLGMDKVPVYVDKDSYKLGSALGLFE